MPMNNANFRLLCHRLGFFSTNALIEYLKHCQAETYGSDRAVRSWFNGAVDVPVSIPESVLEKVQALVPVQEELMSWLQVEYVERNRPILSFQVKESMWSMHPRLAGLPVTFFDQTINRWMLKNDQNDYKVIYFEHLAMSPDVAEFIAFVVE